MLAAKPDYFADIQRKSKERWDQLESDPELAGPWHQLFKQVQSPRHILSELLQNADDAGASEAAVRVADGIFEFEHNGEDFSREHFASLCRFGYSNKRALHTIGFRGIGFKSTFSLGDRVELFSPSLAVAFHKRRFTEPEWAANDARPDGRTRIRVTISDSNRQRELEKNLGEWLKSPLSLLFFRHIRELRIGDETVKWSDLGPGPVPRSKWMTLGDDLKDSFLVVTSEEEAFPEEALEEIRQERLLADDEIAEFPPCRVDIVLGAKGRLYVVLPTMVETTLPFACNAPFIQDPARLKIKDPETSPTNRWLLGRAGELAAQAMLAWLEDTSHSTKDRADAYGFLPDVDREDNSLDGVCGTIVEESFESAIEGRSVLMSADGHVMDKDACVALPDTLFEVWAADQVASLFDKQGREPLSEHVSTADRQKLVHWNLLPELGRNAVLSVLKSSHLPRPTSWARLLRLWVYVAPDLTGYWNKRSANEVRIVPVQGKDVLYAGSEVARLGEKKLLQSEDDWEFLSKRLLVLNQNWTRFLAEQRREAESSEDRGLQKDIESAFALLAAAGLDDTSDASKVLNGVAAKFFSDDELDLEECVRLAQIAARLGAKVDSDFLFATQDTVLRPADGDVLYDERGPLEDILPENLCEEKILHSDYDAEFRSCTQEEWKRWIETGNAGLPTFPPLVGRRESIYGRKNIEREVRKRGCNEELTYHYVTSQFVLDDWDFDEKLWKHWERQAKSNGSFWKLIAESILAERESYWSRAKAAKAAQVATTGNTRAVVNEPLLPKWVLRLRELPCLPDTHGDARVPRDLLRRTPETESLLDVESFLHRMLDRETTQPLLDLLGVRSLPTGPFGLLDRIRALAKADEPPIHELEKWYRRLDQMIGYCSTSDFAQIKEAFAKEKIVLTSEASWATSKGVFLAADEDDVPGAPTVHPSIDDLTLWRKVEVAERPTADLAIQWLGELPSGGVLSQDDARRVRALLVRYPSRIWDECGHWINLAGKWAPVECLKFALTMQSLVPWQHLHEWVKQATANFRNLTSETLADEPFSSLPSLASCVEDRFYGDAQTGGRIQRKEWFTTIASELRRAKFETDDETDRVRALALRLSATSWMQSPELEIIPYIDGTPAGTPRRAEVIWLGETLHVEDIPTARLAKRLPEEVGRIFDRSDVKAAFDYSFERSPDHVRAYMEENFNLEEADLLDAEEGLSEQTSSDQSACVDPIKPSGDEEQNDAQASQADEESPKDDLDDEPESAEAKDDEGLDEATVDGEDTDDKPERARPAHRPAKASILERFAKAQGFRKESDERFFRDDGSWLARTNGSRFPWQRHSPSGDFERYYWPKDHCLEKEPLQLEADLWLLIDQQPETYALILTDAEDAPVEVTGTKLRAMCERGDVKLYPATYRIVYEYE